jgi:hypothetical protein
MERYARTVRLVSHHHMVQQPTKTTTVCRPPSKALSWTRLFVRASTIQSHTSVLCIQQLGRIQNPTLLLGAVERNRMLQGFLKGLLGPLVWQYSCIKL